MFVDGTANTIAVLEAGRSEIWTSPSDLSYPESGEFRRFYEEGGAALFADGAVHELRPANPSAFHAMFTPDGAEVINQRDPFVEGDRPSYEPPLRESDQSPRS